VSTNLVPIVVWIHICIQISCGLVLQNPPGLLLAPVKTIDVRHNPLLPHLLCGTIVIGNGTVVILLVPLPLVMLHDCCKGVLGEEPGVNGTLKDDCLAVLANPNLTCTLIKNSIHKEDDISVVDTTLCVVGAKASIEGVVEVVWYIALVGGGGRDIVGC